MAKKRTLNWFPWRLDPFSARRCHHPGSGLSDGLAEWGKGGGLAPATFSFFLGGGWGQQGGGRGGRGGGERTFGVSWDIYIYGSCKMGATRDSRACQNDGQTTQKE